MTTILGLDAKQVVAAVQRVHPLELTADAISQARDVFARGVWGRITEPGDAIAGRLVSTMGAGDALEAVLQSWTSDRILSILGQQTPDAAASKTINDALERWRPRLDAAAALRDFSVAKRFAMKLLVPTQPEWPQQLSDLNEHAPHALWVRGESSLLPMISLAVVGSRASTAYGESITSEIVAGVAGKGVVIVSGGAYGIDGVAHRTCIRVGRPTIAVLAGGADRFYPSGHESLLQRVSDTGLVCAEQPPGSSPTKWRFLQRNRIIAALTQATLVAEAGHRSGSLNTAGHAAQLGRALGAVPGSVYSASSAGCHRLLREYAAECVRNTADALGLLGVEQELGRVSELPDESGALIRVFDALAKSTYRDLPRISQLSGVSERDARAALQTLEAFNFAKQIDQKWRQLQPNSPSRP